MNARHFTIPAAIAVMGLLATRTSSSAQVLISIPNGSFETHHAGYTGSPYADQTEPSYPYNPTGTGEPYDQWLTAAANYQVFSVSTSGATGTFDGANAVQVNGSPNNSYQTMETLNPVVASIANNATYTLTFALANDGGGAGDVTLSLLTTTSAPNTTDYSGRQIPNTGTGPDNPARYYPAPPNPYPIITTVNTIASNTISGGTINAQTTGNFVDYSVSFDTLNGDNAGSVGQNLTLGLYILNNGSLQFDNARLTVTEVPEPGTWAMLLGGAGLLAFCVRRKAEFLS